MNGLHNPAAVASEHGDPVELGNKMKLARQQVSPDECPF